MKAFVLLTALLAAPCARPDPLPHTRPLDWHEADLSARLMDGAHQFVERKIAEAKTKRHRFWTRDFSSPTAYLASIETNRALFKTIIGAVDTRLPASMEYYGDEANPALLADTTRYQVYQVRWPVLEDLFAHGLRAEGTFDFLHHHLRWPKPANPRAE